MMVPFASRWCTVVGVVGVVVVMTMISPTLSQCQPPHILFIVADDLGWNDVGWHNPNLHTPTLSWYADHGIILNNSYMQPMCTPSRAAFLSGMYPYHVGLQHFVIRAQASEGLPVNLTTLPEALQGLGYSTHMVGKWHLGFCKWEYTPTYRGFDSFLGFYNGMEDYYTHSLGLAGHDPGYDFRKDRDVDKEANGTYSTYLFTERAVEIVTDHDMTKPLFLYLPLQLVHGPLQVPKMYEDQYCSKITNATRKTKCGMIALMDEAIKNITQVLDARGFFDNMLMIFTSDNGGPVWVGGNNWPLRGAKKTLWEGGTRAAAFVYSKNLLRNPGTVHNGMMHAVDWYPTLLNLAGGTPLSPIDGINQWESIADGDPSPRTEFVYNMDDIPSFSAAIRMGDWKLIQGSAGQWNDWYPAPGEPGVACHSAPPPGEHQNKQARLGEDDYQLFNIKDDPTEHNDVKDQYPDVLAKMKARLTEWRGSMVPAQNQTDNPAADPKNFGGVWSPGWC